MISEIVSIGDKLELRKCQRTIDKEQKAVSYTSQILDITSEGFVNIAMPIEKGRIIPLTIGDKYQLIAYSSKGLYSCDMEIVNRYKDGNIHILTIKILSEFEKFQRRQFYRLDCILDVTYHCVSDIEALLTQKVNRNDFSNDTQKSVYMKKLDELENQWYQGTVTDLSGGGARFVSDRLLQSGLPIIMVLDLQIGGTTKKIQIHGMVISSIKVIDRIGYYENRVKYVELLQEERETIIKFIFEEERRLRKRDKGLK